ncbi:MAG: hypothetical protein J5767_12075 [Paludibacteraceae bacterium]|nr:hypothetical protein [Paludibacteraceae bacterium]
MLNAYEAKVLAWITIADFFGKEYFKAHFEGSCESFPEATNEEIEYEYFLGFEGDEETGLWSVFARVLVNRETRECVFLDYKTPDGRRMENPLKPTSFA